MPLRVDSNLKGLNCPGKQTGSHKSCLPFVKIKENHVGELIHLQLHGSAACSEIYGTDYNMHSYTDTSVALCFKSLSFISLFLFFFFSNKYRQKMATNTHRKKTEVTFHHFKKRCIVVSLCYHSPNDITPEPRRNVSIAAVRGFHGSNALGTMKICSRQV